MNTNSNILRIIALGEKPDRSETALFARLSAEPGIDLTVVAHPKVTKNLPSGIKTHPLAFSQKISPAAILELARLFSSIKPTLVHAFTSKALSNGILAALGRHLPFIAYRGTMGGLHFWDPTHLLTYRNPKVKTTIAVCDAVRESMLSEGISANRVLRIYKGHQQSWYEAIQPTSPSELGLPADAQTIICVANFRKKKGLSVLLKAFARIAQARPEVHLLVVGNLEQTPPPFSHPQQLHYLGFRTDVLSLVKGATLFVLPSLSEGLARAAIEALSLGTPAIVSATGGLQEIVQDTYSGLQVPPGDDLALEKAISHLLDSSDLRHQISAQGKQAVSEKFSFENYYQQILALYRTTAR